MTTNNKNILYCSFCGKSQHEVRKLIAGPTVFICDECVELCMDIIKEENKSVINQKLEGIPSPIEINKGPIILCPPNKSAKNFFKKLGLVIEIGKENLSYKFWATASIMAAFYELLNVSSSWLIKKGIKRKISNQYISELFLALSQDAFLKKNQGFKKLVIDSQTPKGLNEQVLKNLKKDKFFSKFIKALESINRRVGK